MAQNGLSWKNILYSMLGVILPMVFKEIINADPNFPLAENIFVELVLYLIAFLVGGWNIASTVFKKLIWKKYGVTYDKWIIQ